ncbi:MAG TPA: STAS domain-containing protein [Solirubrobacteraceae bacterium]|nr:STAS domain-containing protein [Solirubrobacteraceae bacterium]
MRRGASAGAGAARDSGLGSLTLRVEPDPAGGSVVRVSGELDVATAPSLEDVVDELAARGEPVGIDLSGVTFADAAGFHVLLCACVLPRSDAAVRIVRSCPAVCRLVELALEAASDDA